MATISEEEKLQRRHSVLDVLGTHVMEGLEPDATTSLLLEQFAQGELSGEELSAAIDAHVQRLLTARGLTTPASAAVNAA